MQRVKKLLFLALLFFPLGELGRFSITSTVALTLNDIIVSCVVILWFIEKLRQKDKALPYLKQIIFFWIVAFGALILSPLNMTRQEFLISFLYLLRFIIYSSVYFVVIGFDYKVKQIVAKIMVFSGSVFLFLGFAQYFIFPDLRPWFSKGWDQHLYRLFGTFLDPNFTGAFFVLFFIFVLGQFNQKKQLLQQKWIIVLGLLTAVAIFLTYSRSAILAFFVTMLTYLIICKKLRWIMLIFIVFVLGLLVLSETPRSEGTNLLRTASVQARSTSINQALIIFKGHPVLGVGFDAYRYAQKAYGYNITSKFGTPVHSGAGTDNSFLFVLATTGITGFVSYLLVLGYFLKETYRKRERQFALIGFLSLIALMVDSLFVNSLFYPFLMEWGFVVLGLGLVENK